MNTETNRAPAVVVPATGTLADRQSAANFASNARALSQSQPRLLESIGDALPSVEWIFARDRTLTARDPGGRWWAGCSVPSLAARAQLKTLRPVGGVACFIEPPHAAHIRAALEMMPQAYAIVCAMRDLSTLRVALGCEDFSSEIDAGRLFFAWGETWANEMARLFDERPGLPTPAQFIRVNVISDDVANDVITTGQKLFGEITLRRADAIRALAERTSSSNNDRPTRLCVAAGMSFRLWDDAGFALTQAIGADRADALTIDIDDPRRAAPLALARAASECDAVVTANVGRANLPGVVSNSIPWITWATTPNLPAVDPTAPRDALFLADPSWREIALARGWHQQQIHVGTWPIPSISEPGEGLGMIADTSPLDAPPRDQTEFSSHVVLWERVRDELLSNPFALTDDVNRFLDRRMAELQISEEGFDRARFVERLILPAYQQGLASVLINANLPFKLYGKNWPDLPRFQAHAAGVVPTRDALVSAALNSTVLVHCWPGNHRHAIDALGRPVLRRTGPVRESLVRAAKEALSGKTAQLAPSAPHLTAELIRQILK